MTAKELELESFRQIRRKISDISDESNNDEISGFVKGIVSLEKELYSELGREDGDDVDKFIEFAYNDGIDFSYMGSGDKDGRWFCQNVRKKFEKWKESH